MKTDARTFFITVIGIPLALSGVWGVHALDARSARVVDNEVMELATAPLEEVEEKQEEEAPAPKPVVKPVVKPTPATVPAPQPVPPVVTQPTPAPTPKPVVVKKKSRKTRAS